MARSPIPRLLPKSLAYLAGTLLFALPWWTQHEYGRVTIDQVLYHFGFGAEALFSSDPELARRLLWQVVLPAAMAAIVLLACDAVMTAAARRSAGEHATTGGLPRRLLRWRPHLLLAVGGLLYFGHSFALVDYVRSYYGPDLFSREYADPAAVAIDGSDTRSLVLIYVESLENTYSERALFGHDLLARLNRLKAHGISFRNYREKPGAHFTIAGIVATQCGIPLRSLAMFGGNDQGEKLSRFLPQARCLGDILHDRGYANVFLNGSDLAFAGVGKFFHDHHYDKVMGRKEWLALGAHEKDMSGWGLHDDDLFERARAELDRLVAAGRPFNLNVLTIDTHHPYGHLSRSCAERGVTDFEGIVECSADQVAAFVEYIVERGWLDRIAVLVQGDHLAMGNTSYQKLISEPNRTVFNLLLGGPGRLRKNTEDVTHFDMLPTMLELIGLRVEGDRAGLGYSAIGAPPAGRPTDRMARIDAVLANRSPSYLRLWEAEPPIMPAARPAPADATLGHAGEFDFWPGAG